jgi:tRNA 2-thiocytidine biosynthesis protein TtcA
MFRALCNVVPSHLADTELFDFKSLQLGFPHGIVDPQQRAGFRAESDEDNQTGQGGVQMMERIELQSL